MHAVSIVAINAKTGEEMVFPSVRDAAEALGCYPSEITMARKTNGVCHGHYIRLENPNSPVFERAKASSNICFDCQKACGGCSWSEVDQRTGKVKFEPVAGWTAEKVPLNIGGVYRETYHITSCPEFVRDSYDRKMDDRQLTVEQSEAFLQNINSILRRWRHG